MNKRPNLAKAIIVVFLIFVAINLLTIYSQSSKTDYSPNASYTEFVSEVNQNKIKSVQIIEHANGPKELRIIPKSGSSYVILAPHDESLIGDMIKHGVDVKTIQEAQPSFFETFFYTWGPTIWLLAVIFYATKKMSSGGKGLFQFNKSKAQLIDPDKINVRFNDIVGCDEAKAEAQEFVEFLRNPEKFSKLGGKIPRGVLLTGPAGTGKAQPLDSKILTPHGWRRMGDLSLNDEVCDPDGGFAKIVGIFPQGLKPNFRISYDDGTFAESCDEHLWSVSLNGEDFQVLPLRDVADRIKSGMTASIKPITRIDMPQNDSILNPLLIGSLYGDLLNDGRSDLFSGKQSYLDDILISSYEQRLSFVKGLLDFQGRAESDFASINLPSSIAYDVADVFRTLGYRASVKRTESKTSKVSVFGSGLANLFSEPVSISDSSSLKTIERIEFVGNEPMQCIMLDSENKLYVTDGCAVTHNTMIAKALAKESGVSFLSISGSEFVEMFVGIGASRVRDLFETAKKKAPCVIFIDEIDAIGAARGGMDSGGHSEREQTLNQILVELDGFDTNKGVILVAATNRPEVLDKALLRPGRIDRQITVGLPDVYGRESILNIHSKDVPLEADADLIKIARGTPGFSGAELANLINEAAIFAARRNKKFVDQKDLEDAKDKIMMGVERPSLAMSVSDKRDTAYHESGHAVVAKSLTHSDPVHKVTIIPRGRALGLTMQLPEQDRFSYKREYLIDKIAILMGGRAAEEVFCHTSTNGASNDIEVATNVAKSMVVEWGMSELGPIAFGVRGGSSFLGGGRLDLSDLSPTALEAVEKAVFGLVNSGYDRAKKILIEKKEIVEAMTSALMDVETIDDWQIENLMNGRDYDDQEGYEEFKRKTRERHDEMDAERQARLESISKKALEEA